MSAEQRGEAWEAIDAGILRQEILPTLKAIRAEAGVGLKEAIDIYHERFETLLKSRRDEFTCDIETYWEGCYS